MLAVSMWRPSLCDVSVGWRMGGWGGVLQRAADRQPLSARQLLASRSPAARQPLARRPPAARQPLARQVIRYVRYRTNYQYTVYSCLLVYAAASYV